MFSSVGETGSEKGLYDFVLSTRVSDPLSVRSVAFCLLLAAALKTSLRGMDFTSL